MIYLYAMLLVKNNLKHRVSCTKTLVELGVSMSQALPSSTRARHMKAKLRLASLSCRAQVWLGSARQKKRAHILVAHYPNLSYLNITSVTIYNIINQFWVASILVNKTSRGFLKSSRGLRQGDPLSPFLFSLVAESLKCHFKKGRDLELGARFRYGRCESDGFSYSVCR